jgi:hypothetical protein
MQAGAFYQVALEKTFPTLVDPGVSLGQAFVSMIATREFAAGDVS